MFASIQAVRADAARAVVTLLFSLGLSSAAARGADPSRGSGETVAAAPASVFASDSALQGEVILTDDALADLREAVASGLIEDPAKKALPVVSATTQGSVGPPPCLTTAHIIPYEDTDSILTSNYVNAQLFALMGEAATAAIVEYGDNFDFIGFWLNFVPDHQIGGAFYLGLVNDIQGLGLSSFDRRADFGVPGTSLQGFVMMWNVATDTWQPGTDFEAYATRLVLGQEFEHRWAMYLPPLPDGRVLQGNDSTCGRSSHWSFRVDGQASGMEIAEWWGASPAYRVQSNLLPNKDTLGGMYSYTDLYLMGYVSPEEMDANNSELRYMDFGCGSPNFGGISTFTSADVIASAGSRVPNADNAQKHYKTAWIMFHQPGAPPTAEQLSKAARIQEQHTRDWYTGTLGRGTMDNSLYTDCNCNSIPDGEESGAVGGCTVTADNDGDGDVDVADFSAFFDCAEGPLASDPTPECEPFDFDADADVDLSDFRVQQLAHTGDCDMNVTQQPADVAACAGEAASFTVQLEGVDPVVVWIHNGQFLGQGIGYTLDIPAVDEGDEGVYGTFVRGLCGMRYTETAQLTVHVAPEFVIQPEDAAVCEGDSVELSIEVSGFGPFTYQWRRNDEDVPGATSDTLVIDAVGVADVGAYRCVVHDGCANAVQSAEGDVSIAEVAITLQPTGGEFCTGAALFLTVGTQNADTYQWFKDGFAIPGATSFFYVVSQLQLSDTGTYHVVATGMCDSAASDEVVVDVVDCSGP